MQGCPKPSFFVLKNRIFIAGTGKFWGPLLYRAFLKPFGASWGPCGVNGGVPKTIDFSTKFFIAGTGKSWGPSFRGPFEAFWFETSKIVFFYGKYG